MTNAITVYGAPWCPDCKRSKKFLAEHRVAFDWVDIDQDPVGLSHVEELQHGGRTIPTVVFAEGDVLFEPSNEELAKRLGLVLEATRRAYDLVIIGGGPAGLTAAIYAAREGIDCIVVDSKGLGGQAGVTERLENYPGFPDGIGGAELADRFVAQARRYGVELLSAVGVRSIGAERDDVVVQLATDQEIVAHSAIVATGSTYRRLGVPGEDELIGASVHFCSTCDGPFYRGRRQLGVIGGGNSACEEALFLTQFVDEVIILQLEDDLSASALLQEKVRAHPKVTVRTGVRVVAFEGEPKISGLVLNDVVSGSSERLTPDGVFVFIGLEPNTDFLGSSVNLDERGFVRTDGMWQTSLSGVFAAGDVRAGSTKQLAAAVGEGVTALYHVRQFLQQHAHLARLDMES